MKNRYIDDIIDENINMYANNILNENEMEENLLDRVGGAIKRGFDRNAPGSFLERLKSGHDDEKRKDEDIERICSELYDKAKSEGRNIDDVLKDFIGSDEYEQSFDEGDSRRFIKTMAKIDRKAKRDDAKRQKRERMRQELNADEQMGQGAVPENPTTSKDENAQQLQFKQGDKYSFKTFNDNDSTILIDSVPNGDSNDNYTVVIRQPYTVSRLQNKIANEKWTLQQNVNESLERLVDFEISKYLNENLIFENEQDELFRDNWAGLKNAWQNRKNGRGFVHNFDVGRQNYYAKKAGANPSSSTSSNGGNTNGGIGSGNYVSDYESGGGSNLGGRGRGRSQGNVVDNGPDSIENDNDVTPRRRGKNGGGQQGDDFIKYFAHDNQVIPAMIKAKKENCDRYVDELTETLNRFDYYYTQSLNGRYFGEDKQTLQVMRKFMDFLRKHISVFNQRMEKAFGQGASQQQGGGEQSQGNGTTPTPTPTPQGGDVNPNPVQPQGGGGQQGTTPVNPQQGGNTPNLVQPQGNGTTPQGNGTTPTPTPTPQGEQEQGNQQQTLQVDQTYVLENNQMEINQINGNIAIVTLTEFIRYQDLVDLIQANNARPLNQVNENRRRRRNIFENSKDEITKYGLDNQANYADDNHRYAANSNNNLENEKWIRALRESVASLTNYALFYGNETVEIIKMTCLYLSLDEAVKQEEEVNPPTPVPDDGGNVTPQENTPKKKRKSNLGKRLLATLAAAIIAMPLLAPNSNTTQTIPGNGTTIEWNYGQSNQLSPQETQTLTTIAQQNRGGTVNMHIKMAKDLHGGKINPQLAKQRAAQVQSIFQQNGCQLNWDGVSNDVDNNSDVATASFTDQNGKPINTVNLGQKTVNTVGLNGNPVMNESRRLNRIVSEEINRYLKNNLFLV